MQPCDKRRSEAPRFCLLPPGAEVGWRRAGAPGNVGALGAGALLGAPPAPHTAALQHQTANSHRDISSHAGISVPVLRK